MVGDAFERVALACGTEKTLGPRAGPLHGARDILTNPIHPAWVDRVIASLHWVRFEPDVIQ